MNWKAIVAAVAVVGAMVIVMLLLARHGVDKYLINAQTAEAKEAVGRMAKDAESAFERNHKLCPTATRPVPEDVSKIVGRKYQSSPGDWDADKAKDAGFACLKFTMRDPQLYQYSYSATGVGAPGDRFTATAKGDLDGDGEFSTFSLSGVVGPDGKLVIDSQMHEIDPEE